MAVPITSEAGVAHTECSWHDLAGNVLGDESWRAFAMRHNFERTDELFCKGWLQGRTSDDCLSKLARIADELKGEGAFESDTIAIFVEPVLRGLGWETLNHEEVDRAPRGNYPDFELYTDSDGAMKRVAIIEVKTLDADDRYLRTKALEQLYRYVSRCLKFPGKPEWIVRLTGNPIVCGVVTNGKCWHIYDFHGDPPERESKCDFELQDISRKQTLIETLGRRELASRMGL